MATVVNVRARGVREHRFFFVSACVMAATIVAGFSLQWLMGRSTLRAPLHVHIHAWLFMGWTVFYVFQTHLITRGARAQHRRLGWIGALWASLLVLVGIYPTVVLACEGRVPFRSEEHTSELQSLMRISYAVFCLKKKKDHKLHYYI